MKWKLYFGHIVYMVSLTAIFVEYITFKCDGINGTPLKDGRAEIRSKEVQIIAALKI